MNDSDADPRVILTEHAPIDTVVWVGDDASLESSIASIAHGNSWRPIVFPSAPACLRNLGLFTSSSRVGCLVAMLDGECGAAIMEQVRTNESFPLTVFMTLDATADRIVDASQSGAAAVLEATCEVDELRRAIEGVMRKSRDRLERRILRQEVAARLARLKDDDLEVMQRLMSHHSVQRIAQDLGISVRTVEARQARILKTLGVRSLAELAALTSAARVPAALPQSAPPKHPK